MERPANYEERHAEEVAKGAIISDCQRYRYQLTRSWDGTASLPFVMLNPSTADASNDDPTIRRCMSFAKREGAGGIVVANLFAFRATSPSDMKAAADPFGPDNELTLRCLARAAVASSKLIVCAWGTHGDEFGTNLLAMAIFQQEGAQLVCLGKTKDGHPRHPLYVKGDQPLVPFP
jgi:hypothetical protein